MKNTPAIPIIAKGENIEKFATLIIKKWTLLPIQHKNREFSSGNILVAIICFVETGTKELFVREANGIEIEDYRFLP